MVAVTGDGGGAGGFDGGDGRRNGLRITVTSADIVNGTIRNVDVHDRTITGGKVALNTLSGAEVNESTLGLVPNADRLDGFHASQFVVVHDADSVQNVFCGMIRVDMTGIIGSDLLMVAVNTVGPPLAVRMTTTTIPEPVIDNWSFSYSSIAACPAPTAPGCTGASSGTR